MAQAQTSNEATHLLTQFSPHHIVDYSAGERLAGFLTQVAPVYWEEMELVDGFGPVEGWFIKAQDLYVQQPPDPPSGSNHVEMTLAVYGYSPSQGVFADGTVVITLDREHGTARTEMEVERDGTTKTTDFTLTVDTDGVAHSFGSIVIDAPGTVDDWSGQGGWYTTNGRTVAWELDPASDPGFEDHANAGENFSSCPVGRACSFAVAIFMVVVVVIIVGVACYVLCWLIGWLDTRPWNRLELRIRQLLPSGATLDLSMVA